MFTHIFFILKETRKIRFCCYANMCICFFKIQQKIHSAKIVFMLLHVCKTHVHEFIFLFSHVLCLCALTCKFTRTRILFFIFQSVGKRWKTDEVCDESKVFIYLFSITILYHMATYSKKSRPDAAEHSNLLEECLRTTNALCLNVWLGTS